MSFIDKFLDWSATIPRETIRLWKLMQEVDRQSAETNIQWSENRKSYLIKIKSKPEKNENVESEQSLLKKEIDEKYRKAISLSKYKQQLLKELNYIVFEYHLKNWTEIIEKESKNIKTEFRNTGIIPQPMSYMDSYDGDSLHNYGYSKGQKKNGDNYSINTSSKDGKWLGRKKVRSSKPTKKKNNGIEQSDLELESTVNMGDGFQHNEKLYCICKGLSQGNMICCDYDKCSIQWFHYECVDIKEEPGENAQWFCSEECRNLAIGKEEKQNKKKKKK